jgi:hypothetical protein
MRKWTEEEEEIMRQLYPHIVEKVTIEEIAELLHRTPTAVRNKARMMGLKVVYEKPDINGEMLKQLQRKIKL